MSADTCPRCGSTNLTGLARRHETLGDYDQTRCEDCEHHWGDGLPEEAARPLPDGFEDCTHCAAGDLYGRACAHCHGTSLVATT